ncbi:hypothetical protein ACGFZZ_33560 [Streptomyces tendae]|uniref:hypothetical protein n=1 Tax=Streptomyces tendae TaxID=1932 RepID=UPI00371C1A69
MQHTAALCQLDPAQTRSVGPFTTPAGDTSTPKLPTPASVATEARARFELVRGSAQDIVHTSSRRAEPRDWLVALDWMIYEAQLHPKANQTTVRVAMDLASRMDYDRGIVLYRLLDTAAALGVDKSTVKRHVSYLREMGALVWLEHGSKRNLRLPGRKYTATATIYGATIPPAYDTAKGHRLSGTGYEARIVGYTEAGRKQAVAQARRTAGRRLAPPSRCGSPDGPVAEVGGKEKATRGARPARSKPPKKSTLGHRVTAALFQAADRLARRLRPLHNWTQRAKITELSWVLVDKLAEGCSEEQVDAWLRDISPAVAVGLDWRPNRPHTYIASQLLRERAVREADAQLQEDWANASAPNADFGAAVQEMRLQQAGEERPAVDGLTGLDQETRTQMCADGWAAYKYRGDPSLVLSAYEVMGPAVAYALYGHELVDLCLSLDANSNNPHIRLH